jgi:hypothetical protein
MVTDACNPSYLEIGRISVPGQPRQKVSNTPKSVKLLWYTPVIPDTREDIVGRSRP